MLRADTVTDDASKLAEMRMGRMGACEGVAKWPARSWTTPRLLNTVRQSRSATCSEGVPVLNGLLERDKPTSRASPQPDSGMPAVSQDQLQRSLAE